MTYPESIALRPCTNLKSMSVALLGVAFLCSSPALLAQEEDDEQIETIVVTAQKREQSILDVPFSISAVSQQEMEAAGVNSMADIFRRVPSLSLVFDSSSYILWQMGVRGDVETKACGGFGWIQAPDG